MKRTFLDLLKPTSGASSMEVQGRAILEFPKIVEESPFHLWKPGDPITHKGRRVLLGVAATYSLPDLYLLDTLAKSIASERLLTDRIDVFNTTECETMADFKKYFPGIGDVLMTPVAGIWLDEVLRQIEIGWPASQLVASIFGFEFDTEENPVCDHMRNLGLMT